MVRVSVTLSGSVTAPAGDWSVSTAPLDGGMAPLAGPAGGAGLQMKGR